MNSLTLLRADGTFDNKKEGELFMDDANTRALKDDEIDQNTKTLNESADDVDKNPHTWDFKERT